MYAIKKYFTFSSSEILQLLLTAVFGGFFISFNDWGDGVVDINLGVSNFLTAVFGIILVLGSVILIQKLIALHLGYKISYVFSWFGLFIGMFITFLSNGVLPFFIPGGLSYDVIKRRRIGRFHPDVNFLELSVIILLASFVPLVWSVPFGGLFISTGSPVFRMLTTTSLFLAFFSLIPLPLISSPLSYTKEHISIWHSYKLLRGSSFGYDLWSFSHSLYIFMLVFVIVFSGLVLIFNKISFLLSFLITIFYLWFYKLLFNFVKR